MTAETVTEGQENQTEKSSRRVIHRLFFLFILLAGLNLLDGLLSYWGFTTGRMKEMNPLMESVLKDRPNSFLTLKIWISVILFGVGWLSHFIEKYVFLRLIFKIVLYFMVFVYSILLIFHGIWIFKVFVLR